MLLTDLLDKVVAKCGLGLMNAYGVKLHMASFNTEGFDGNHERAAIIGYYDRKMEGGSIALWISDSVLKATAPGGIDEADWLCELLNQFVGRVLNELLSYDLHLLQGTPVVVKGRKLDLTFSGDFVKQYLFVDEDKGPMMEVFFESSLNPNLDVKLSSRGRPSILEGESIIF